MKIQHRSRYGVWQALGDIGGFYDGLGLIFSSIISSIAATQFLIDLFSGIHVDDQSQNFQERKKLRKLAREIENSERHAFANHHGLATLQDAVKHQRLLKISLLQSVANFGCRLLRKNKGQRLIQRIQEFHTK